MHSTQGRVAVPESLKTIFICVESYEDFCIKGLLYHNSFDEGQKFENLMQLLLMLEKIQEDMGFPRATTEKRGFQSFKSAHKEIGTMDNVFNVQNVKGKVATFKVKIMFRQNASWQGSVSWMEGNRTEPFRSTLELLMLMHSAMS